MSDTKKARRRVDVQMEQCHNVIVATFKHDEDVTFTEEAIDEFFTYYAVTRKRAFLDTRRNTIYFHMIKQGNEYWFSMDVTCQETPDDNEYVSFKTCKDLVDMIKYILWTRQ